MSEHEPSVAGNEPSYSGEPDEPSKYSSVDLPTDWPEAGPILQVAEARFRERYPSGPAKTWEEADARFRERYPFGVPEEWLQPDGFAGLDPFRVRLFRSIRIREMLFGLDLGLSDENLRHEPIFDDDDPAHLS